MLKYNDLLLYAVTDRSWLRGATLYEQVEEALKGGATMIQLREKEMSYEDFRQEALDIQKLCRSYGVPFLINDNVELALEIDADGVHVGQSDLEAGKVRELLGSDKIIGVTAKTVEQAQLAYAHGADYLGSGAVFGSSTKKDAKSMTLELLQEITASVSIPVVAIGGITLDNVESLAGTGIAGAAVVSGLFASSQIKETAEAFCRILKKITARKMPAALTIAGSDSSGGAGIQADIKTMTAHAVYAMSAITALTAQNTCGVSGILEVTPDFLAQQLDAVFSDIFPDAVKTGMVSSSALIRVIAEKIRTYGAKNLVIDPVMVATSGSKLISDDAIETLKEELLPLATVITPNIPETEVLTGRKVETEEEMIAAAKQIYETYGCAVLCKGGHQINDANDLLYSANGAKWFRGRRIQNPNTHGTGCTLSSAIASNLAKGENLEEAVLHAKNYISGALAAMLDLGAGSGPMNHAFAIEGEYKA